MPGEEIAAGLESGGWGYPDSLTMKSPILLAIVEFHFDTVTDFEMMV